MSTVEDTAYLIAHIRAVEASLPPGERLFDDPFAPLFRAGKAAQEGIARFLEFPFVRHYVRLRTRFIDDVVRAALRGGTSQVVFLGAGFDARALRLPEFAHSKARVFEIDFPSQLEVKRSHLNDGGIVLPPFVRHIGFDFAETDFQKTLLSELEAKGFRPGALSLFVYEGVVPWVDDAAVDRSLAFMAHAGGAGAQVVVDYHVMRMPQTDVARRLVTARFTKVEDTGLDVLYRRYIGGEPPDIAPMFRVVTGTVER